MTDAVFSYRSGAAVAICGGGIAVLVDVAADDPIVSRLAEELPGAASVDEVLETLISSGLHAIASFGVLQPAAEGARVVVRGACSAALGGGEEIQGQGLWVDRFVSSSRVTLTLGPGGVGPLLGLASGVVLASELQPQAARAQAPIARQAPSTTVNAGQDASVTSSRAALTTLAVLPAGVAAAPPEPPGTAPAPSPPTASGSAALRRADHEPQADDAPMYDDLFAQTVNPRMLSQPRPGQQSPDTGAGHTLPMDTASIERAREDASRAAAAPQTSPADLGGSNSAHQAPMTARGLSSGQALTSSSPGFIADVPTWMTGDSPLLGSPPRTPTAPPVPVSGVAPGSGAVGSRSAPGPGDPIAERTVSRAALRMPGGPDGPLVLAARCPYGHLSPAHAAQCRVCRHPVPPQPGFEVARPALGRLRFSNGEVVVLDRSIIMGRNPMVPPGYTGEQPNLLKLSDPGKDISSQHAEVRLDYWHVVVNDLGSTNGTHVVLPGREPLQLRPDDPVAIEPGTRVILAGFVDFTFEVTE